MRTRASGERGEKRFESHNSPLLWLQRCLTHALLGSRAACSTLVPEVHRPPPGVQYNRCSWLSLSLGLAAAGAHLCRPGRFRFRHPSPRFTSRRGCFICPSRCRLVSDSSTPSWGVFSSP
ncbi:hypothetical protein BS78_04G150900 [Paspalum vaginatum]|nr:hypothetical protein BS78_04G150900 [Paspalum vaginatum]